MTYLPLIGAVFKLFVSKEMMPSFGRGLARNDGRAQALEPC